MAREILFRGHNGKNFVYGDLVHDKKGVLITNAELDFVVIVNPDSVGQFTGLTDKNGVKVFEGDVIDCAIEFNGDDLPHRGIVIYNSGLSCFCTRNEAGDTPFYKHKINSRRVIGNVFENPELMAGEKC